MKLNITTPVKPIPHRITNCFEVISVQSEWGSTVEIRGGYDDVVSRIKMIQDRGQAFEVFWYDHFGDKYQVEVLNE
jgi:hypothetical protein